MILTTDADSQVAPNWIAENLAAFEAGARRSSDKSILMAKASSYQRRFIGAVSLRTRTSDCSRSCRGCLTPLSKSLAAPRHHLRCEPWGDSYGLLPRWAAAPYPLGRGQRADCLAFASGCEDSYCPTAHVITSGRTDGRAPEGVADTLAIRSREPDAFCDDALEPPHSVRRASWRGRLRRLHDADALLWIKTGRRSLDSWPATSVRS